MHKAFLSLLLGCLVVLWTVSSILTLVTHPVILDHSKKIEELYESQTHLLSSHGESLKAVNKLQDTFISLASVVRDFLHAQGKSFSDFIQEDDSSPHNTEKDKEETE